jgi:hypothetical protein
VIDFGVDLSDPLATSHTQRISVDVLTQTGTVLHANLDVIGGQLRGDTLDRNRYTATLTLPVGQLHPQRPTDPLAGITPHRVRLHGQVGVAGVVADAVLADLWVVGSTWTVAPDADVLEVTCGTPAVYLDSGDGLTFTAGRGETCRAMIERVVTEHCPVPLTVQQRHPGLHTDMIPPGYRVENSSVWSVVDDLAAIADLVVYFDRHANLVITPATVDAQTPVLLYGATHHVTGYTIRTGRDLGFANDVQLEFQPAGVPVLRLSDRWTLRLGTGSPAAGEAMWDNTGHVLRLHKTDASGDTRPSLERRIQPGDYVELVQGATVRSGIVDTTTDQPQFLRIDLDLLTSAGTFTAGGKVLITVRRAREDTVTARHTITSGPYSVGAVGRVTRTFTLRGYPSQQQANRRARTIAETMRRSWADAELTTVPDPRVNVDDWIVVDWPDDTRSTHRVLQTTMPLPPSSGSMLLSCHTDTPPAGA